MNNNPSPASHSSVTTSGEQGSPSSSSTNSGHRPKQFQFRKGYGSAVPKPEGEQSDFKTRVLAQWNELVSEFDAHNESILKKLSEEHAGVWRDSPRVPLVLQPLSTFEQRCFSSGHLQSHVSMRDNPQAQSAGAQVPLKQTRENRGTYQKKPVEKERFSSNSAAWREEPDTKESEEGDETILWATEETGVGMFDSQGNFKFITESAMQDQSGMKSQIDKSVFFGSRPVQPVAPAAAPVAAPAPKVELPITETKEWYYKDPKGNTQGPFQSSQMLDWYNRHYFPEHLPLKRSLDTHFEPLSIWMLRCDGRCPFEPTKPKVAVAAPGLSSPPAPSVPEVIQFGSLSSADDPIVNVPVRKSPILSPTTTIPLLPPKQPEPEAPKENEVDKQARFLESLMLRNKAAKAAPVSPQAVIAEQAEQVKTKYSAVEEAPAAQPPVAWKTVNTTSPSLVDIKRQQEVESAKAKQQQQPAPSGPKSFADLLAGTSTPTVEPKKPTIAPISKPTATMAQPSQQQQPQTNNIVRQTKVPSDPLKEWMSSKLKAVDAVDSVFLHSLLSECSTAEEAAILLRDNLLVIPEDSVDLKGFSREYLKRRFGKQIPAYVLEIVSPRAVDDRDLRPEAEFSTVTRKKK